MYVSISAYRDGDLLRGCLDSIREVLPEASIAVVDGKYETWPGGPENSEEVEEVAEEYGVSYHADGPYEREREKHLHRVHGLAPEDERILLLDADERLIAADFSGYDDQPLQPRIFNAKVYNGTPNAYWPRSFYRGQVLDINRWDAYYLSEKPARADEVTILHRHDLRAREYREAKYQRFRNEGRAGRMDSKLETYFSDSLDVEPIGDCPECGEFSVVASPPTNYSVGKRLSYVRACLNGDCFASVEQLNLESWEYVPDNVIAGFEEDPAKLRAELVDAGCALAKSTNVAWLQRHPQVIISWVREHEDELIPRP